MKLRYSTQMACGHRANHRTRHTYIGFARINYCRLEYSTKAGGGITSGHTTSRDRDRNSWQRPWRTPIHDKRVHTKYSPMCHELEATYIPHRKAKLPLEPQGHDEHEERHAGGGG